MIGCPKCKFINSNNALFCNQCGAPLPIFTPPKRNPTKLIVFGLIALIALGVGFDLFRNEKKQSKPSISETVPPLTSKEIALKNVSIDVKGSREGFGTVLIVSIAVHNPNSFAIKDLKIKCDTFGSSGTKINSKTETIYEIIPAKKLKTIKDVNFGFIDTQTSGFRCSLEDLETVN